MRDTITAHPLANHSIIAKEIKGIARIKKYCTEVNNKQSICHCGITLATSTMRHHLKEVYNYQNNITFHCPTCNKIFYIKFKATTCNKKHTKSYKCEFCKKKFTTKANMNYHITKHH